MDTRTLRAHLKARGWSQSDLGRRVGVSRQAVSQWMSAERANLRASHLLAVAGALGVSAEQLDRPLPALADDTLTTTLLWDRLYPGLDDFAVAVNRWEPAAVARLVQVYGLYASERILGRRVWAAFDSYKKHIHPSRRRSLEALVKWQTRNPTPS